MNNFTIQYITFKVFTVTEIQVVVLWVLMLCSNMVISQCFGGPCCLHHHNPEDRDSELCNTFASANHQNGLSAIICFSFHCWRKYIVTIWSQGYDTDVIRKLLR